MSYTVRCISRLNVSVITCVRWFLKVCKGWDNNTEDRSLRKTPQPQWSALPAHRPEPLALASVLDLHTSLNLFRPYSTTLLTVYF